MSSEKPDLIDSHILRTADSIGALMEFWGFKRNMGRMWATLYLTNTPLSAADLGAKLQLSTGSVSMTLSGLSKWGVVKKSWKPGERRDFYEPETSIWKMVSRVFRERELLQIQSAIEVFDETVKTLKEINNHLGKTQEDDRKRLNFAMERVASLLDLAKIGERILSAIISERSIDLSPLKLFKKE